MPDDFYDDPNADICYWLKEVDKTVERLIAYEKSEEKFVRDYMVAAAATITPFLYRIKEAKRAYKILMDEYAKDKEA